MTCDHILSIHRRIRVARVVLLVWLALIGCASTNAPMAVVDMKRAMRNCRDGRVALEDLRSTYRASQATLDQHQRALLATINQIRADRARGIETRDREAAVERDVATLGAEYQRLQKELSAAEMRRAAPIQDRLNETLRRLTAARHLEGKVSVMSPVPNGNQRTIDLTADLIQAADAQPPLSAGR